MKKLTAFLLLLALLLAGCTRPSVSPKMWIEPASLSEKEQNLADLLGMNSTHRLFDFSLADGAQSVRFNIYELTDGHWQSVSGGGHTLTASSGRLAMSAENPAFDFRIAIQCGQDVFSSKQTASETLDFSGMSRASASLSHRAEVLWNQEIPIFLQIVTSKTEIRTLDPEFFHTPEVFAPYDHDHIYAATVQFSQSPLQ